MQRIFYEIEMKIIGRNLSFSSLLHVITCFRNIRYVQKSYCIIIKHSHYEKNVNNVPPNVKGRGRRLKSPLKFDTVQIFAGIFILKNDPI